METTAAETSAIVIKDILNSIIGQDNTQIVNDVLKVDYGYILSGILLIVVIFMIVKGVFALCKR